MRQLGESAAKPKTAVQDCVSRFVSMKPLESLSQDIPAVLVDVFSSCPRQKKVNTGRL